MPHTLNINLRERGERIRKTKRECQEEEEEEEKKKRKKKRRRSKHLALRQLDKNTKHILTLSCCFPVALLSILPISSTSPYTVLTTSATRGAAVDTSTKQQGRVEEEEEEEEGEEEEEEEEEKEEEEEEEEE